MRLRRSLIASLLILAIGHSTAVRADLYWDSNGNLAGGSNTDTAVGTWGVDNFWSADLNGLAVTGPWTADETAVFSADANVTGTYGVTVSGTQSASGIRFEEGTVTLNGGTVNLANAATVNLASGLTATINSVITGSAGLTQSATGGGTLVLGGANTYSGNTILASNPTAGPPFNTLRLGASGVIPDLSIVQILGANSSFELNNQTETVKSISGGGTNSRLDVGTGTLILNDLTGENSTFSSQMIAGPTGKIIKNGDGQINVSGSSGSWDGEFVLNQGILGVGPTNFLGTTSSGTARLTINGGTVANAAPASSKTLAVQNIDITNSFSTLLGAANMQFVGFTEPGTNADEGSVAITLKVANPTITTNNLPSTTGTFILTGPIGDEGQNRGITKAGPGVLTLNSATNSYGGDTTILAGQIRIDANARLGDGTGAINFSGGNLATTRHRDPVTDPIVNPINMTADAVISTTRQLVDPGDSIEVDFTSSSITASAGTLTFRNDATGTTNPDNQFEPRFSGSGFNFGRPIVIAAGLNDPVLRTTRFSSANASGTQTYSNVISGPGKFRRMNAGATVLTGANTYSGGTDVEGGTLTVNGFSATLGAGDVTVTGGTLTILSGVSSAIDNAAALSISGTGVVNLGAGINDLIAALTLGGVAQTTPGTYGTTASGATFQNNVFFAGTGVVTLAPPAVDDADFDADGDVDGADFLTWQRGLGLSGGAATLAAGNANNDAVIDGADLTVWRNQFGLPAVPAVGAVPEPAAAWIMLAALAGLSGRRLRACSR